MTYFGEIFNIKSYELTPTLCFATDNQAICSRVIDKLIMTLRLRTSREDLITNLFSINNHLLFEGLK